MFDFDLPHVPESLRLIVLAILQGVAEFLPISSSGHLNVFSSILGGEPSSLVNIALHAGTLLSICVYYRKKIVDLLSSDRRVIPLLIVGTIPAALIGIFIKKMFPWILEDVLLTGVMLVITGIALMYFQKSTQREKEMDLEDQSNEEKALKKSSSWGRREYIDLGYKAALFIGVFQAFALMPGISRSGFTILAGVLVGLRHKSAATFSFLLAIPAILGATILETLDLFDAPPSEPIGMLLVAAVTAFVVGLLSLAVLVKMLDQGKLHWFALWVLPLGLFVIIWQLYERLDAAL